MTIDEISDKLQRAYSRETAHAKYQESWTADNPTAGHCAIASMIVQEMFGGELMRIKQEHHFYNVIDGVVIDLTREQYQSDSPTYSKGVKANRPKEKDCLHRYELLKQRVMSDD